MTSTETIHNKIQMLPGSSQKEVIDFIDNLLEKIGEIESDGKGFGLGRLGEKSFK